MKSIFIAALSICTTFAVAPSYAGEPIRLTNSQMDQVTAGAIQSSAIYAAYQAFLKGGAFSRIGRELAELTIERGIAALGVEAPVAAILAAGITFLADAKPAYTPSPALNSPTYTNTTPTQGHL